MQESRRWTPARIRPLTPIALTVLLLAAGFFARPRVVDAITRREVPGFSLHAPLAYAALAPLSNLLDGLTLLSTKQLIAVIAFVLVIAAIARARATARRESLMLPALRVRDHFRFAATVLGGIVAVFGLALLMVRPMSGLRDSDADVVTVDFHSHTSASHDGRPEFTPEANREWHRKAGFDVAYITDHHSFAGARAAMVANPRVAAEGTVLLTGLEYRDGDEHVLAIGLDPARTDPERREWHPLYAAQTGSVTESAIPALLILCIPGNLNVIPADEDVGVARLGAIEISDGSPKGIAQTDRDRGQIIADAKRMGVSLVSGSDNHGWGKAALGWSVLRIHGWRAMTPEQLDVAIRSAILTGGAGAVQVISRRLPSSGSSFAIAMTAPQLAWDAVRDASWRERIFYVLWLWFGWGALVLAERRRFARHVQLTWNLPELIPATGAEPIVAPD